VLAIQKSEMATLAAIGALNSIAAQRGAHRRDALWQIERAERPADPLFEMPDERAGESETVAAERTQTGDPSSDSVSPLQLMTTEERLVADFHGTGMTVGPHPMRYHRAQMKSEGILSAVELSRFPNGMRVGIAGSVIARQRPGTAKGFVFLSMEDETGIANIIITPQLFQQNRIVIVHHRFLVIEGRLQNQENVVSVKAESVRALAITQAETTSHDFH
jgi:error-prone DNA polymerase